MNSLYDLIVIGGGPAGLSTAIYAGRAMLRVLVIDTDNAGGQIAITAEVVNYPGIMKTSGAELMSTMGSQVKSFGADVKQGLVAEIDFSGDIKTVKTTDNQEYKSLSVVIATGARPRTLGFQGEKEFTGRGVAYCATCDGEFFKGMDIFVIGGGFAAAEEAIFLTRFAKKVNMIVREPDFTCAAGIAQKVRGNKNIVLYFESEVVKVEGDSLVRSATIKNNKTGEIWNYKPEAPNSTFGLFVFVGYEPISELFKGKIALDEYGYIPTNEELETDVKGVYAAGDIRPKRLRQLVTAVSDGAIAATAIERFVDSQKEKLNIKVKSVEHIEEKEDSLSLLDADLIEGLKPILERLDNNVTLNVITSKEKEALSAELVQFVSDIANLSDKISVESRDSGNEKGLFPVLSLQYENGEESGIYFHGVPSGHEFNSFVLALYNVAGPGQTVEPAMVERMTKLKPAKIYVGATLNCTMCPDVVQATGLIAKYNPNIEAHMIDISHFPNFKEEHNIMSVPAMLVNDKVSFGRKSLEDIVEMLENAK